jgi:hypothetical protein
MQRKTRKKTKLKIFSKLRKFQIYPKKILKLNRPKWKVLQQIIRKISKKRKILKWLKDYKQRREYYRLNPQKRFKFVRKIKFINFKKKFVRRKNLRKLRLRFKNFLLLKRLLLAHSNFNFRHYLHKGKLSKEFIEKLSTIFLFKFNQLKFLLYISNFVVSIGEASKKLECKEIFLNKKKSRKNIKISIGDIIEYKNRETNIKSIYKKFTNRKPIVSLLETDYYLQKIIKIKDIRNCSMNDLYLNIPTYISTSKF